jgi:metal-sulfur cluster biosynthetic enzyme
VTTLALVPTRDEVIEALRQVEDPELGMDIVDLGLLYDVEVEGPRVKVTHSLTSMGCPVGPLIQEDIDRVTRGLPGVEDVDVELTWDPPWTPDKMSDDAKFILGFG